MQDLDIKLREIENEELKMKNMKLIIIVLASFMVLSLNAQRPVEVGGAQKVEETKAVVEVEDGYKIDIQTSAICEMCKETLEYDLAFEKGVKEAVLNLDNKVLSITYNPKRTDPKKLRERITKVGYHADWMERDSTAYSKLAFCCKDGSHGTPVPQVPIKRKGNN